MNKQNISWQTNQGEIEEGQDQEQGESPETCAIEREVLAGDLGGGRDDHPLNLESPSEWHRQKKREECGGFFHRKNSAAGANEKAEHIPEHQRHAGEELDRRREVGERLLRPRFQLDEILLYLRLHLLRLLATGQRDGKLRAPKEICR